jgi:KUP system potassium uptake protein
MTISNPEFSETPLMQSVKVNPDALHHHSSTAVLTLAAIGVVFGDIGTSPLYALKECFAPEHGIPYSTAAVYGIVSLIFWSLTLVVTLKYVTFVLRADNHGEGGVLSLMALALRSARGKPRRFSMMLMLGALGACMLLGESVITPAISVLSAVEGLEVVNPDFKRFVIPLTVVIIIILFGVQRYGTAAVGRLFGPVMLIWFSTLAVSGVYNILQNPSVLLAVSPMYAYDFIQANAFLAYIVMGSVVLCVTGVEALYLDMGHFGRKPVRLAWLIVTLPSLLLNYFGQAAFLIEHPEGAANPFFMMLPEWAVLPMIGLATAATVIASQAVISGAFSLASQGILLGFLPRMVILHTSDTERGQIYMPTINWTLLVLVLFTVFQFRESGNLAAAYGISVTTTMLITTSLLAVVMLKEWKMPALLVAGLISVFFIIDFAFWTANLIKVKDGGWYPMVLGAICFVMLTTWYTGRRLLRERLADGAIHIKDFVESLLAHPPHRVGGTSVFLTPHIDFVPIALLHNLKHNRILHERVIFLKLSIWDVPYVEEDERMAVTHLGGSIFLARAVYGFKETPDVRQVMEQLEPLVGGTLELEDTTFFLARDTIIPSDLPGMALWRERLFAWMMQNAATPSDFFKIPPNRVVELGTKIEI